MDLLKRTLAPLLPEAWAAIDAEAIRVLELNLAGRKIADFRGPYGWTFAAVNTGRIERLRGGGAGDGELDLQMGIRRVQPLIELRVPLRLSLADLDDVARGAVDPNLDAVVKGAERMARAEDAAIFNGFEPAGIVGLLPASPHAPQAVPKDLARLPEGILAAKDTLRRAGVSGPYALVLGRTLYDRVFAASDEGHPLAKRIEQLLVDRPIVRAEAIADGGAVLSMRGGDFELTVGQDLSIGYAAHDRTEVELFLTESFTFRVLEPAAAVRLVVT